MHFREAKLSDLPRLRELEQQVVQAERPFDEDIKAGEPHYYDIEELIRSANSYLLVCEHEEEIIATGYTQIRESRQSLAHAVHAYLGFMYVSPDWRGQSLNKRILERLQTWSEEHGARHLYLEVYSANAAAIRAYQKVGFEPCLLEMKLSL